MTPSGHPKGIVVPWHFSVNERPYEPARYRAFLFILSALPPTTLSRNRVSACKSVDYKTCMRAHFHIRKYSRL